MALTDTLKCANVELEEAAGEARTRFNGATAVLHLFANDITPAYNNVPADFTAPTFPDYETKSLTGRWSAVAKEEEGVYYTQTEILTYAWEGAGAGTENLYGLYLAVDGVVRFAGRFPGAPLVIEEGGDSLRLRVIWRQRDGIALAAIALA